jgi:hemerythrin-like domain-containing protein
MMHTRQTSRALHEEHRANLALLGRLETALGRAPRRAVDATSAGHAELTPLIGALARQIEHDVERHFEFEERELFSRMGEAGEGDIAALLAEEHDAIREVAADLLPLTRAFADGSLDDAGWQALSRAAFELVERQVAHIQKEEMALLPLLEDLLDDDTDRQLAMDYTTA